MASIRFAVVGDAEPKPLPEYRWWSQAMRCLNRLHDESPLQAVVSTGDVVHGGRETYYEAVTPLIRSLNVPFFPMLGNEEAAGGLDLYRRYADQWRDHQPTTATPPRDAASADRADEPRLRYVLDRADVRLVFLSAESGGVVLSDDEIAWACSTLTERADVPGLLFTHAPAPGIFAAAGARTLKNTHFTQLQGIANLCLWFSGHTHFNLDEVDHVQVDDHGVAHVHVPGTERTKVGTVHVPRFRVVEVDAEKGRAVVETFNIETERFEPEHRAEFAIRARSQSA